MNYTDYINYAYNYINYAYAVAGIALTYFVYTEIIGYLRGRKQRKKIADYERRTAK